MKLTGHYLEMLFGAAISLALGIGAWLFKWTRGADVIMIAHAQRLETIEDKHRECIAERMRAETELWARFNSRMDALTAQLTGIAQSIGRLEGKADR